MEYIDFALSESCQPVLFDDRVIVNEDSFLDRSVLDSRCSWSRFLDNIDEFLSEAYIADSATELLLSTVEVCLQKLNRPAYIISLSGGVDSMSLLLLLAKLRVSFAAVHIRHSSRSEDTKKELEWVQFVCKKLKVPLYYHHVLVARPHGSCQDSSCEISRDEFEEYTRKIRFCMYRKAFKNFSGSDDLTVLIGHHMDDVDENRIAELGKGNLINLDGMAEDSNGDELGSVVVRPLCASIRKSQLREFAIKYHVPHMKNSTPKWSKRGWIRDVLDSCSQSSSYSFLPELNELGKISRDLDSTIDKIVQEWTENLGVRAGLTLRVNAKSKQFKFACGMLDFDLLESLASKFDVWECISKVASMSSAFGSEWNKKVADFCLVERPNVGCPIQKIREWISADVTELKALVYSRCLQKCFSAVKALIPVDRFITKKSVCQLIESFETKTVKNFIYWKINTLSTDVPIVQIEKGRIFVLRAEDFETISKDLFEGNRDALRKTIVHNITRIVIE